MNRSTKTKNTKKNLTPDDFKQFQFLRQVYTFTRFEFGI